MAWCGHRSKGCRIQSSPQPNTTGLSNTAIGWQALKFDSTGGLNIAVGSSAGVFYTTGDNNIAIGIDAAHNVSGGNSNNIHLGSEGTSGDEGVISIGTSGTQTSAYIAGIAGVTLPTANEPLVCIDPPTGQLGTVNCAANGMIETLQKQNEELLQRVSRLESLIARK
jgi:hypothetical protein